MPIWSSMELRRQASFGWLAARRQHAFGEPPMCNGMGCGHWSVISGYAGKNSSDPEWIMQDPRGYPEMEKGAQQPTLRTQRPCETGCVLSALAV